MSKIVIIGGGGYAKMVAETVLLLGYNLVGFVDDNIKKGTTIFRDASVLCSMDELIDEKINFDHFVVAIGDILARKSIYNALIQNYSSINIIHPKAVIAPSVKMDNGNVCLAGAVLNTNVTIGENNIINSMVLLDHDTIVGDHCNLSQGSVIGSNVKIFDEVKTTFGQHIPSFSEISNKS